MTMTFQQLVISEWNDNFGTYTFPNACPLQKAIKKTSLNSFWVRIFATGRVISFAHAPTIGKQIVWEGLFSIQSWLNLTPMGNVSPVNQPITSAGVSRGKLLSWLKINTADEWSSFHAKATNVFVIFYVIHKIWKIIHQRLFNQLSCAAFGGVLWCQWWDKVVGIDNM